LKFNRVLEIVEVHVHAKFQNLIKLSAAVYELSCAQTKKTPTKTILSVATMGSNYATKS